MSSCLAGFHGKEKIKKLFWQTCSVKNSGSHWQFHPKLKMFSQGCFQSVNISASVGKKYLQCLSFSRTKHMKKETLWSESPFIDRSFNRWSVYKKKGFRWLSSNASMNASMQNKLFMSEKYWKACLDRNICTWLESSLVIKREMTNEGRFRMINWQIWYKWHFTVYDSEINLNYKIVKNCEVYENFRHWSRPSPKQSNKEHISTNFTRPLPTKNSPHIVTRPFWKPETIKSTDPICCFSMGCQVSYHQGNRKERYDFSLNESC